MREEKGKGRERKWGKSGAKVDGGNTAVGTLTPPMATTLKKTKLNTRLPIRGRRIATAAIATPRP